MYDINKSISNTNYDILMAKKDGQDKEVLYLEGYLTALQYVKTMIKEEVK